MAAKKSARKGEDGASEPGADDAATKKASPKKRPAAKAAPRKKATPKKPAKKPAKKAAKTSTAKASKKKADPAPVASEPSEAEAATPKAPARKTKASKKKKAGQAPKAPAVAPPKKPAAEVRPADDGDDLDAAGDEAPAEAAPKPKKKRPRPIPKMPPRRADGTITVAYSPDADDAFMFYALLSGKVDTEGRRYELVQDEIQVLNDRAREGTYDVTAISFGAYPVLADRYMLLTCGASFGDQRGPVLVARTPVRTNEVHGLRVAVPGLDTTAALALRLWLPHAKLDLVPVPFDQVVATVQTGHARAGVLIHEAQLAWRELNLVRIVDFGQWWGERTEGLPLPLGANAIRRDIPEEERKQIALDIKRSIAYGLGHREETLEYATKFAKGLPKELVDRYVSLYVGELALDFAERGRQAVREFLGEAHRHGFLKEDVDPEFV